VPYRVVPLFVISEVDGLVHRRKCARAKAVDELVVLRDGRDRPLKVHNFEFDLLLLLRRLEEQRPFFGDLRIFIHFHAIVSIVFIAIFAIIILHFVVVHIHIFIQVNQYFQTRVLARDVPSLCSRSILEKPCNVSLIIFEVGNLEFILWLIRVTLVSGHCPSFAISMQCRFVSNI